MLLKKARILSCAWLIHNTCTLRHVFIIKISDYHYNSFMFYMCDKLIVHLIFLCNTHTFVVQSLEWKIHLRNKQKLHLYCHRLINDHRLLEAHTKRKKKHEGEDPVPVWGKGYHLKVGGDKVEEGNWGPAKWMIFLVVIVENDWFNEKYQLSIPSQDAIILTA